MNVETTADVSQRQPPETGSMVAHPPPIGTPPKAPAAAGRTLPSREKQQHRRVDAGQARPAAVPEPIIRPEPAAHASDSIEQFVFRHGEYFDSYLATEPGRCTFWSGRSAG